MKTTQAILSSAPPDLGKLVKEYDVPDMLVIGELHSEAHKNYFLQHLPILIELGYNKVFLESAITMNEGFRDLKTTGEFPYNSETGTLKSFVLAMHKFNVEMRGIDLPDLNIKGKDFRRLSEKLPCSKLKQAAHEKKDTVMHETALRYNLKRPEYVRLCKETDIAAMFGSNTWNNLGERWQFKAEDRIALNNTISYMQKELINSDLPRLKLFSRVDPERNRFMCEKAVTAAKGEKAILYVGSAHIRLSASNLADDMTIQAILNEKYDVSTLAVDIVGAHPCMLYECAKEDWIDRSEINFSVAKLYSYSETEITACLQEIEKKYFIIDQYEENNLNEPDIHIHLPQKPGVWA